MVFFFSKFEKVADVSTVKNKTGIITGDIEVMLTVDRKKFMQIPNILTSGSCHIYMVIERRRPLCWVCETARRLSKAYTGKRTQPHPLPTTSKETAEAGSNEKLAKRQEVGRKL